MKTNASPWPKQLVLFLAIFSLQFLSPSYGDLGRAAQYGPPYLPTACFGNDRTKLPPNNLFAAAGEGIWNNGAACGRRYVVNCLSAASQKHCFPDETIQIVIVDRASSALSPPSAPGTTMVLCNKAFAAIADPRATSINIEFQQV